MSGGGNMRRATLAAAMLLTAIPATAIAQAANEADDRPLGPIIHARQMPQHVGVGSLPSREELLQVDVEEDLQELVSRLNAHEYDEREAAFNELLNLRVPDIQFYAVLERGGLSAEQRHRMLTAVYERVVNAPRGAIGVRMDLQAMQQPGQPPDLRRGVVIVELIPGLPAERVLRVNDRITHINDARVQSSEDLVVHVQARRPGDVIQLKVLRPRRDANGGFVTDVNGNEVLEQIDVELELGSVDGLRDPRTGAPPPPTRVDIERRRVVNAAILRYGDAGQQIKVIELENGEDD